MDGGLEGEALSERANQYTARSPASAARRATGFMAELRERTRPQHQALEACQCLARLYCDDYCIAEYRALLVALHQFQAPLETHLFDAVGVSLAADLGERRRAHALAADIAALGGTPSGPVSACYLPPLRNPDAALGALYVLEGSTLGGTLILRRLDAHFGGRVRDATRYHSGYGSSNGAMWRAFKRVVERRVATSPTAAGPLVGAAAATFSCLGHWLSVADAAAPRGRRVDGTVALG